MFSNTLLLVLLASRLSFASHVVERRAVVPNPIDANQEAPVDDGLIQHTIIAEDPNCKEDVSRLCSHTASANNFAVLSCLQNDERVEGKHLSQKCHHLIWQVKRNLTSDNRFRIVAKALCKTILESTPECNLHDMEGSGDSIHNGHLISCLIDHMPTDGQSDCRNFLNQMEVLIFSDFRLIDKFSEKCGSDIEKYHCGRLSFKNDKDKGQGQTIECLQKETDHLEEECKHEILRVSELQSEDFHMDRALYFACRDDRERFCPKIQAGEGRVYRCLMHHQQERDMSRECRSQLKEREKLVVHDYKVSRKLSKVCRDDIRIFRCRGKVETKRQVKLAQILLCLENSLSRGYPINGDCQAEMFSHRRALLEDYHLTPNLVVDCENDITQFCGKAETGGKTLHCLMKHVKSRRRGGLGRFGGSTSKISERCRHTMEDLLKEVNIGEDWRVDPVLQEACQTAVDYLCSGVHPGNGRVLSCLMDHIESPKMAQDCRSSMLQIQYFIARDFDLDAALYKSCHSNATALCHAKEDWHSNPDDMDPERGPTVIACLYRYAYHPDKRVALNPQCLYDVKRVMRQRAMNVELHPEIEEPCMDDLSKYCSGDSEDVVQKGFEIECLQDRYETLDKDCQIAIANYTAEESEHLELNYPLFKACADPLKQLCNDDLDRDVDEGDLMECLILNKNKRVIKQNPKCRVAIEHFQLLSIKDVKFNFKFKEACKSEVLTHCRKVKTKYDVVSCLSTIVFNDTFSESKRHRISPECKKQLKFEILQKNEDIKLDPHLYAACDKDRVLYCSDVETGEARTLECLKTHFHELSKSCRKHLFKSEKIEMADNSLDYTLVRSCKIAIRKFCESSQMNDVLFCLRDHRNDVDMDAKCRHVIMQRLAEQNHDYRLNPRLKIGCQRDMHKFCAEIIAIAKPDEELDGKMITCLKKQYSKTRLSQPCEVEVVSLMREVGQNYELDPNLSKVCKMDIDKLCADESDVQECLKAKFQGQEIKSQKCKESIAELITSEKADIKSDPLLFKACISDIKRYCLDIPSGHGKQLSCLMAVEEAKAEMTQECRVVLRKRVEMFEYAAEVAPVESIQQLVSVIRLSPSRNYFFMTAMMAICFLFMGGLCCGRVTKKVPISVKNK